MTSTIHHLPVQAQGGRDSPHFILIEPKPDHGPHQAPLIAAWNQAISSYFPTEHNPPFTVLEGKLGELDAELLECDCVVSPANSFGIMDGGYDGVLSHAFKGNPEDYWRLTNQVQAYIKREWYGYLPPGSCIIVPLPANLAGTNNPWKARFIATLPTMRVPEDVSWHKDLVYNCTWSLQVAIENWNRDHGEESGMIKRVLLTGLATGYGQVGPEKCAAQMVLAVHHFLRPVPEQPRYDDVLSRAFNGASDGYWTLTNHVQAYIKREWHGYLPPGSCMIVPLPPNLAGSNNLGRPVLSRYSRLCVHQNVSWHKDLIYNSMWALQVAVESWNKSQAEGEDMIQRVLMTGLATGCGRIGPDKCAGQMILAVKHFRESL